MIAFCLLAPALPEAVQVLWPGLYWLASGMAIIAVVDYLVIGNRFAAGHVGPTLETVEQAPCPGKDRLESQSHKHKMSNVECRMSNGD